MIADSCGIVASLGAEGLDFDFDKNVLQPLRLILGRQPVTAKTSLSCYYPKCAWSPKDCDPPAAVATPPGQGRLCLRVFAEISDGQRRSYVSTRVQLDNTLKAEIRQEFSKIAEEAILRADPVTAALVQLKHVETDAFVDDTDRIRAQERTVKAANEAPKSSCWRRNILARMYVATGDFGAAERELLAAGQPSILERLALFDWTSCTRQTEFSRALYRRKVLLSGVPDVGGVAYGLGNGGANYNIGKIESNSALWQLWPESANAVWFEVYFFHGDTEMAVASDLYAKNELSMTAVARAHFSIDFAHFKDARSGVVAYQRERPVYVTVPTVEPYIITRDRSNSFASFADLTDATLVLLDSSHADSIPEQFVPHHLYLITADGQTGGVSSFEQLKFGQFKAYSS